LAERRQKRPSDGLWIADLARAGDVHCGAAGAAHRVPRLHTDAAWAAVMRPPSLTLQSIATYNAHPVCAPRRM